MGDLDMTIAMVMVPYIIMPSQAQSIMMIAVVMMVLNIISGCARREGVGQRG